MTATSDTASLGSAAGEITGTKAAQDRLETAKDAPESNPLQTATGV